MTPRRLGSAFLISLIALVVVAGAARPSAADNEDSENTATIDLMLSEAAVVRITPEANAAQLGTVPVGGVATIVWSGRRQDAAGGIWVRVRAPFDGWMPGAAVGITTVSLGTAPGLVFPTEPQPLTGPGPFAGPLPAPTTIGAP